MSQQKHIVVHENQLQDYLDKGYEKTDLSPVDSLGVSAWALLSREERAGLVVVSIDEATHRAINTPEVRYHVSFDYGYRMRRASVDKLDVLEPDSDDFTTVCVPSAGEVPQEAAHAKQIETRRLAKTRHEAVQIAKPDILQAIAELRADAERLENVLKHFEVV